MFTGLVESVGEIVESVPAGGGVRVRIATALGSELTLGESVAVAKALHGLSVSAAKYPGVIMDVNVDANGDLDRESFIVEVKNGKQEVKETLPPLGKK